jgi:hypothetical protein
MSKRNKGQHIMNQVTEGGEMPASVENEVQGTIILGQEQEPEIIAFDAGEQQPAEPEAPSAEHEVQTVPLMAQRMGIGQFCRFMMLKSTKSNSEILELVLKLFPEAKTTPACIAWYKTDLRKKGLLPQGTRAGATKVVQLSSEELAALVK